MMKERTTTSPLKRILVNCGLQVSCYTLYQVAYDLLAKEYGSCVAAKVPQIERDMCLKEFLTLKNCMQSVLKGKP
ncbi:hypothetical protein LXL04_016343 [Taraxacum kok-saghyz]